MAPPVLTLAEIEEIPGEFIAEESTVLRDAVARRLSRAEARIGFNSGLIPNEPEARIGFNSALIPNEPEARIGFNSALIPNEPEDPRS